ncbi:MAG: hypothetical protein ACE5JM_05310 [Armatimonadota bacterium]
MSTCVWSRRKGCAPDLALAALALLAVGVAAHAMVRVEETAGDAAAAAPGVITVKVAWVKEPVLKAVRAAADDKSLHLGYTYGSTTGGGMRLKVGDLGNLLALKGGLTLDGDETVHDAVAGLTTVLGPNDPTVARIFGKYVISEAQILRPAIEGDFSTWPPHKFEFSDAQDGPQHYLEPAGDDLYRRAELPDKEGYVITVRPTGPPENMMVEVEFARNVLGRGKYDGTIRAFVGRPTVVKTIVIPTVSLAAGQRALLVWEPQAQGEAQRVMARLRPFFATGVGTGAPLHRGGDLAPIQAVKAGKTPGEAPGVAVLLEVGPTPAPGEGVEE